MIEKVGNEPVMDRALMDLNWSKTDQYLTAILTVDGFGTVMRGWMTFM